MIGMFEPYAIYRNVATGAQSHNLRSVLPKQATVNPLFTRTEQRARDNKTLFREVMVVPREEALDAGGRGLMSAPTNVIPFDRQTALRWIGYAIMDAIYRRWSPGKFHVIFHSSGYDSRIMSAAILWLYRQHGAEWLGDTLFVCASNECDQFEQVMRHEGWPEHNWLALRDTGPLVAKMIDFDDCGRWLNGVMLQAVDYNWLLPEYLQEIGAIPREDSKVQLFSGRNEVLMGATMPIGNKLHWSLAEAYDAFLALSRYKVADVVFPFGDHAVIGLALASCARFDWSTPANEEKCHFRRDISDALVPGLAQIPRNTLKLPDLTAEQVAAMRSAYGKSWYSFVYQGKLPDPARNPLGWHPWWSVFTAAALCAALQSEGWELDVG